MAEQFTNKRFEEKLERHQYAKAAAKAWRRHALTLLQEINDLRAEKECDASAEAAPQRSL